MPIGVSLSERNFSLRLGSLRRDTHELTGRIIIKNTHLPGLTDGGKRLHADQRLELLTSLMTQRDSETPDQLVGDDFPVFVVPLIQLARPHPAMYGSMDATFDTTLLREHPDDLREDVRDRCAMIAGVMLGAIDIFPTVPLTERQV